MSPNAGSLLLVLHEYLVSCNYSYSKLSLFKPGLIDEQEGGVLGAVYALTHLSGMALSQLSLVGRLLSLCSRALKV